MWISNSIINAISLFGMMGYLLGNSVHLDFRFKLQKSEWKSSVRLEPRTQFLLMFHIITGRQVFTTPAIHLTCTTHSTVKRTELQTPPSALSLTVDVGTRIEIIKLTGVTCQIPVSGKRWGIIKLYST